jgi:TRAP-type C4-dicarboxylate transport system permease small subunit
MSMKLMDQRLGNDLVSKISRVVQRALLSFVGVAACGLIIMTGTIILDVGSRFLFNRPILGVIEINTVILVWIVYGGIAYCQMRKEHIEAQFLLSRLPVKAQIWIKIFTLLIVLVFIGNVLYATIDHAWSSFVDGTYFYGSIRFPLWPAKTILSLGIFMLFVQLLLDMGKEITDLRKLGS